MPTAHEAASAAYGERMDAEIKQMIEVRLEFAKKRLDNLSERMKTVEAEIEALKKRG